MDTNKMTKVAVALAIIALIAGLSACDQLIGLLSDGETPQMMETAIPQLTGISGEIPIGVVSPVTGSLAEAGARAGGGLELAVEEINNAQLGDARLTLISEDGQSTVEGAVAAFNKLIHQESVSVILGPATSSQAQAVFPIAQANQVVAFSSTSAASGLSAIGDFVFRASLTTDALIPSGVKATHAKLEYRSVATMYNESELYPTDSDEALRKALTENGVKVLATETFQNGDTDFSAQLTRIRELSPDAVFVSALPPEKPGIMIQGRQVGIPMEVPFIFSQLSLGAVENAGAVAEGAITLANWASSAPTLGNEAFVRNYGAKYGVEPTTFAAQGYAAAYILAHAIADAGSTDSTAIRGALAQTQGLNTVLGKFSFDTVGDAVYAPTILIVEHGKFEVFE